MHVERVRAFVRADGSRSDNRSSSPQLLAYQLLFAVAGAMRFCVLSASSRGARLRVFDEEPAVRAAFERMLRRLPSLAACACCSRCSSPRRSRQCSAAGAEIVASFDPVTATERRPLHRPAKHRHLVPKHHVRHLQHGDPRTVGSGPSMPRGQSPEQLLDRGANCRPLRRLRIDELEVAGALKRHQLDLAADRASRPRRRLVRPPVHV